jgi:hypothetical protein
MKINIKNKYSKIYATRLLNSVRKDEKWSNCYFSEKLQKAFETFGEKIYKPIEIDKNGFYKLKICDLAADFYFKMDYERSNSIQRLYIITNEYGPVAGVFAIRKGEALEEAADQGLLDSFLVSEEDAQRIENNLLNWSEHPEWEGDREGIIRLGNAGEPFDSTYLGITGLKETEIKPEVLDIFYLLLDDEDEYDPEEDED